MLDMMILNTLVFEKNGKKGSRLGYILTNPEAISKSEKFHGFSELAIFSNDTSLFDKIPLEFIGQYSQAKVEEFPQASNPLKSSKRITEITCNGKTVRLV